MSDLKTILLPVDFSDRSLEAARQASGIARRVACGLIVLHVPESRTTELQFESGGSCVKELQAYLGRELENTPVAHMARPGDPAQTICRVARETRAELILMAGRNRDPFEDFTLGSVTAEVLASAPCPVWVSLHEERGPAPLFRRVLCPIGLADSTGANLDWALRFSEIFHAACDVIHVPASSDGEEPRRISDEWLTNAERERLDAVRKKLDGRGRLILAAGDLAGAIADASAGLKSDLLVMGRGRPGNEIARVHSLRFTLAHAAPCPVVVV